MPSSIPVSIVGNTSVMPSVPESVVGNTSLIPTYTCKYLLLYHSIVKIIIVVLFTAASLIIPWSSSSTNYETFEGIYIPYNSTHLYNNII